MGRQFSASNTSPHDFLQSAAAIDLSALKSVAVWIRFYWDAFASDDALLLESSDNANNHAGALFVDLNSSAGRARIGMKTPNSYAIGEFDRPAAAAWHTLAFNLDSSSPGSVFVHDVWIDAVSQSLSLILDDRTTTDFGAFVWNFMARNGSALFATGRLAQCALWAQASGAILSQANVNTLHAGDDTTPPLIPAAGGLRHYWKLAGPSPEPDAAGSISLTVSGTSLVTAPGETQPPLSLKRFLPEALGLSPLTGVR